MSVPVSQGLVLLRLRVLELRLSAPPISSDELSYVPCIRSTLVRPLRTRTFVVVVRTSSQ